MKEIKKVVLAYSGGLDTTAIIPWLKENYDYEVICACVDVGQESELDGLDERAKYSGAEKLYILDVDAKNNHEQKQQFYTLAELYPVFPDTSCHFSDT